MSLMAGVSGGREKWGLLKPSLKLPHRFCCIQLAKASYEPPHFQGVDNGLHLLIEGTTKTCGYFSNLPQHQIQNDADFNLDST